MLPVTLSFYGISLNVTENKCTPAAVKKTAHYTLRCEQLNVMWYIKVISTAFIFLRFYHLYKVLCNAELFAMPPYQCYFLECAY